MLTSCAEPQLQGPGEGSATIMGAGTPLKIEQIDRNGRLQEDHSREHRHATALNANRLRRIVHKV
jgi:hypothetical protein